ncbi:non-heme iron oxygenase ferredoxin subunit [Granulosicoccus sp.]|jgi:nitrite reductase/ring-hydroxylating ferredoxin subunit|nr:non-heme iron oxygenase ferredoxin subunit [Granulosicoccus sp.]MDB4223757.1 non-heme iron oxygenase ferredoxin subunit [Granulosicoccus sp.]
MTDNWHTIIALSEIESKDVTQVNHDKLTLAVYDTDDGVFVSDARCTHAGANLCDGYFDGKNIECPLHQGLFDAQTGLAKAAPATRALKMYKSRIHHGEVQITLP